MNELQPVELVTENLCIPLDRFGRLDFVPVGKYWMGKYPVTNTQFYARVEANRDDSKRSGSQEFPLARKPKHWVDGGIPKGLKSHPVVWVSWSEAKEYCKWASSISGNLIRLPSGVEWEAAARGSDRRLRTWGNQGLDKSICNFGNHEKGTTPVGKYSPQGDSPYGCADMMGNVWEWVSDEKSTGSGGKTASNLGHSPYYYIARGGSWRSNPQDLSVISEVRLNAGATDNNLGFRCCLETYFTSMAFNPGDPSTVFLGGRGGVYVSNDGGRTVERITNNRSWSAVRIAEDRIFEYQAENIGVFDLEVATQPALTLFAGTGKGVFKSNDNGRNWNSCNKGLNPSSAVNTIVLDPLSHSTLFVGMGEGLFKSSDGGENWTVVDRTMTAGNEITTLAFDPQSPSILFAGAKSGIHRSTDSGLSWKMIDRRMSDVNEVKSLAVDPSAPTTIYAGTKQGVFISSDAGNNWRPISNFLTGKTVPALAISPHTPNILNAVTYENGLFSFKLQAGV